MEIDRQLHNKKSEYLNRLEAELDTKLQSGHILNERRVVTQLLIEDQKLSEPRSIYAEKPTPSTNETNEGKLPQDIRSICGTTHCFFCYWDFASDRRFSTRYKARDHLERYYLDQYNETTTIRCPSPICGHDNVSGITAFKNHLATEHLYDVFAHRFVTFAFKKLKNILRPKGPVTLTAGVLGSSTKGAVEQRGSYSTSTTYPPSALQGLARRGGQISQSSACWTPILVRVAEMATHAHTNLHPNRPPSYRSAGQPILAHWLARCKLLKWPVALSGAQTRVPAASPL
ncbi:hypothetical protein B0T21DRAFT_344859 [Apiosordaria backusii]|uniref:Uncharacterized protein n=1 Tax=Apiosordaria backusii TaxID=314023 RepID=A0AA40ESH6_9PEZI|nr:hypothetical protein B0T21DRAFT_344859 [Apiosordaria backusii]